MRRWWRWIGHLMRRESGNISPTALHWKTEGRRKRGRHKNTWRRTVEGELKTLHHTWGTVQKLAQNRQERGTFVAALQDSQLNGRRWSEWVKASGSSVSKYRQETQRLESLHQTHEKHLVKHVRHLQSSNHVKECVGRKHEIFQKWVLKDSGETICLSKHYVCSDWLSRFHPFALYTEAFINQILQNT